MALIVASGNTRFPGPRPPALSDSPVKYVSSGSRDREQQKRSVETESTLTFEAVHLSKRVCVLHFIIVPNFLPGRQKVGFVHTRHVIGDKNVYVFKLARRRTMKWILILVQALLQTRTARLLRLSITHGDVTRDDSQRRFLAQHSVAMLEQCCNHYKQCRNYLAPLCCAKNSLCESSRVTSPLDLPVDLQIRC